MLPAWRHTPVKSAPHSILEIFPIEKIVKFNRRRRGQSRRRHSDLESSPRLKERQQFSPYMLTSTYISTPYEISAVFPQNSYPGSDHVDFFMTYIGITSPLQ